ncbi:unnamed protein product [Effrenium voratum]|uniref:Uncharacterized protein n=1 Tax=Effrenium voratum TaxID=2562239 RepID=A0AA36IM22_9DINO|nr:unnamed protein product [Effrenium voratum]CAJ1426260.1 unnamed protein product [Effrenium voratum]
MRRAMAAAAASAASAAAAWEPALRGALACREVRELLGAGFADGLLAHDETDADATDAADGEVSEGLVLSRPLVRPLARSLQLCQLQGHFQRPAEPDNEELAALLVEDEEEIATWEARLRSLGAVEAEAALLLLGCRGIRHALQQRRTVGSCDALLPPSRQELVRSFNELCTDEGSSEGSPKARRELAAVEAELEALRSRLKSGERVEEEMRQLTREKRELQLPGSKLTVGARALAKHAHRGAEDFWRSGSEASVLNDEARNSQAAKALERLLREAVWCNLHALPGGLPTFEVRVAAGYGARWVLDGQASFRGLVEPMMKDGHERRWRH